MGRLLLWWVVGKVNTLCDVALESFYACLKECLLGVVDVTEWVDCLLNTRGLDELLVKVGQVHQARLTPSWMGTEKKSQPVSLAIASPPGTPGR